MGVKKLPTGGWEASYRDGLGRERVKRHRTRAAADRWLAAVKTDLQRGEYIDPRLARSRFGDWADEWLATTVHLKLKTQTGYESMLRTHILPAFADSAVATISPIDVRRFVATMTESGSAPGTVRSARKVLRLVLATAEQGGAIKVNPCNGVRVPRSPRTEMVFLNGQQVEALAAAITPPFGTLEAFLSSRHRSRSYEPTSRGPCSGWVRRCWRW